VQEASRSLQFADESLGCDEKRRQLERILGSQAFLTSRQLRRFLKFVANTAIEGRAEDIKEYTIGTDVFGRAHFDPRVDTLVRTQACRLRLRLKDYYRVEGVSDDVLIDIPKGHYVPHFTRRGRSDPTASQPLKALAASDKPELEKVRTGSVVLPPRRRLLLILAGAVIIFGLLAVGLRWPWRVVSSSRAGAAPDRLVAQLWSGFVGDQAPPIISYSNLTSLMNSVGDRLRYRGLDTMPVGTKVPMPLADPVVSDRRLLKYMGPVFFDDTITGTGEVMAAASLARVFTQLGTQVLVKRSLLLSPADLKLHDVIFLGSPPVNRLLGETAPDGIVFAFVGGTGSSPEMIVNRHPNPSESANYMVERDIRSGALLADYAVVSVMPGIAPNRKIAVLAGINTQGTQAAADFSTSASGIAQIIHHLGVKAANGGGTLPHYFQVVLRVRIAEGDVLGVQYVTGRVIG